MIFVSYASTPQKLLKELQDRAYREYKHAHNYYNTVCNNPKVTHKDRREAGLRANFWLTEVTFLNNLQIEKRKQDE